MTTPLGEPGDHGWFRQEDEDGWLRLYASAGLFVEESEAYELTTEGWRANRSFRAEGVRYGERGPAASAVLCAQTCGPDGSAACSRPAGCAPPLGARRAARSGRPARPIVRRWSSSSRRTSARSRLSREVAQREIVPSAGAWDREHRFPDELYPKLAELGLMGVCVPEAYGGAGADFLSYVLVLEELSRADAGVG